MNERAHDIVFVQMHVCTTSFRCRMVAILGRRANQAEDAEGEPRNCFPGQ